MNHAPQCMDETAETRTRACRYCGASFEPRRSWAVYCSPRCRDAFAADIGMTGKVASVRRLRKGISIVMHFDGSAGERALKLAIGECVRVVHNPEAQ